MNSRADGNMKNFPCHRQTNKLWGVFFSPQEKHCSEIAVLLLPEVQLKGAQAGANQDKAQRWLWQEGGVQLL